MKHLFAAYRITGATVATTEVLPEKSPSWPYTHHYRVCGSVIGLVSLMKQ